MNYSHVVVQEGAEPENFFWVALGGKDKYDQVTRNLIMLLLL